MEQYKAYTGIGSRKLAPEYILEKIKNFASNATNLGWTLRSGAAHGCDSVFELGAGTNKEIYLPWIGYNDHPSRLYEPKEEAYEIASIYHPVWNKLTDPVKRLMARNVHQLLGKDLDTPSKFVLCWTPYGKDSGGTGQTLRMARAYNIPVFNLGCYSMDVKLLAKIVAGE